MSDRGMRRKVALAWELYAVRELGMSAGRAISEFNDWTDGLQGEHVLDREIQILRQKASDYDTNFPCDGGCSINSGPEETCSRHGRSPSDLWKRIDGLTEEGRA